MEESVVKDWAASRNAASALAVLLLGLCLLFAPAAAANTLNVTVTGDGTVDSSAVGILCTSAGGAGCQYDNAGQNPVTVTLNATPQPGAQFLIWGGECIQFASSPTCTLDVLEGASAQSVTAEFTLADVTLTVTLTGTGAGNVVANGQFPGIDCPGDCSEAYPVGSPVLLTASPTSPNSVFTGWQGGGCGGTGACTVLMNSAQSVQANFEADTDGDGVLDPADQCPNTPVGAGVDGNGCAVSQRDNDNDGVPNGVDQCPNTPAGQSVNSLGCSSSQLDADGDGVGNSSDQCPATPAGESVDSAGCGASQLDGDNDGVANASDQCPNTPAGESVDATGCGASQLDIDSDGIPNSADQCPDTAAGEAVDAQGCSQRQLDLDGDGVLNDADQCPNTPAGEVADSSGCSASQRDTDGDTVVDAADQCPDTAPGQAVDAAGCSPGQLDADADGVANANDQCPNTVPGTAVDATGCSELQLFANDLGDLPDLGPGQRQLGRRLDEICPQLVAADNAGALTPAQRDLRLACSRLKNRDTDAGQAGAALDEILLGQLPALQDYLVELGHTQFNHLNNRIRNVRAGGGRGVSVAGLRIRDGSEVIPGQAVQAVFEGLLGIGASEEAFSDFGKLGLFLQGDVGDGKRKSAGGESGYAFDSWNLTLGGDYRFTETFFAGASVNYGHVDVDYDAQAGGTNIDLWAFSLYGSLQLTPNWYLDGLASYGSSDFELTRTVSYMDGGGQFSSSHRGDTSGDQSFLGINTGYTWNRGGWRFGPVASVAWVRGDIDRYTESSTQGSQAWNFLVDNRDIESLRVSAGLQVDYIINTSFGVLIPGLRAAYVKETRSEDENISVRLANNPYGQATLASDHLVVDVTPRVDNFFDASLNLAAQLPFGISGFFSYKFYSAYENFDLDAYTVGLRWDKSF